MNSDQESVRRLVKWLAEQCLENPRYAMMMVVRLCKLQDVPENSPVFSGMVWRDCPPE